MGKKAKKAARELQRLQNLYQSAGTSQPIGVSQSVINRPAVTTGQSTVISHHHGYVKRDLFVLFGLMVVMVAALIGLNLLAEHTVFGTVLAKLVSKFI